MALGKHWIGLPDLTEMRDNGNHSLALDYSLVPKTARFTAPYDLLIVHFSVIVAWDGRAYDGGMFAGRDPLEHGIEFYITNPEGVRSGTVLPGNVVKRNVDFLKWAEDVVTFGDAGGLTPRLIGYAAHYEPYSAWGAPIHMKQGWHLAVDLADDFSSLDDMRFHLVTWKLHPTHPDVPI